MPEAYSELCDISKMFRHIENPGIVRKVYSGIIRYTQVYSAKFSIQFSGDGNMHLEIILLEFLFITLLEFCSTNYFKSYSKNYSNYYY